MMHRPRVKKDASSSSSSSSTALAAVAFQDHLVRNLSLDLPGFRSNRIPGQRRSAQKAVKKAETYQKPWLQKPTKVKDPAKDEAEEEKDPEEFVLHSKQLQPLSLAEKYGFVPAPANPNLSEQDWREVKTLAAERNDFGTPCPICKEDIGSQRQVLLSCSHVFHHNCLQSFERFVGRRSCPLCRKESYEARVVHEGTKGYKNRCAVKIQSAWRGYIARCWYLNLRETLPPKDEKLRKAFYEKKLNQITDRLLKSLNYDVNRFLSEIDESLEASRKIFRDFDLLTNGPKEEQVQWEDVQLKAVMREVTDCPICIMPLHTSARQDEDNDQEIRTTIATTTSTTTTSTTTMTTCSLTADHFFYAPDQPDAVEHSISSGAPLSTTTATATATSSSSSPQLLNGKDQVFWPKDAVLLSCSHVFHKKCLESFESFSLESTSKTCPICRSPYIKKNL